MCSGPSEGGIRAPHTGSLLSQDNMSGRGNALKIFVSSILSIKNVERNRILARACGFCTMGIPLP